MIGRRHYLKVKYANFDTTLAAGGSCGRLVVVAISVVKSDQSIWRQTQERMKKDATIYWTDLQK